MLQLLQNKKFAKIVWTFIGVTMVGFIFWGSSISMRSGRKTQAAIVIFNRPVSEDEYLLAVRATELRLLSQFGEENYAQLKKFFDVKALALHRLVMLAEARKRKTTVSDKELVELIQRSPMFQSKGRFDNSVYEQVLGLAFQMKPRMFEEITRQDMIIQKFADSLTRDITVSDEEVREAYRRENEQVNLEYAAAIPADFADSVNPQDQQLEEYFKAHSADFKKPLSFNLEYLVIDSGFQAKILSERIQDGESLEAVAQDTKLAIQETGVFEQNAALPGIGWSGEVSRELERAFVKQVFEPVEIEKKFYIFRVKERKEPFIPEFKDAREAVRAAFVKAETRKLAREKTESLHAKLEAARKADPDSVNLEKLAKEMMLKSSSTGLFSSGSYIEGVGASDAFFAAASKLSPNEFSAPIDMPSGFYIVRLKEKPPFDEKKFSEDKENFTRKVLNEKKNEFLEKFSEELMKKALNAPQLPPGQREQKTIPPLPPEPPSEIPE